MSLTELFIVVLAPSWAHTNTHSQTHTKTKSASTLKMFPVYRQGLWGRCRGQGLGAGGQPIGYFINSLLCLLIRGLKQAAWRKQPLLKILPLIISLLLSFNCRGFGLLYWLCFLWNDMKLVYLLSIFWFSTYHPWFTIGSWPEGI